MQWQDFDIKYILGFLFGTGVLIPFILHYLKRPKLFVRISSQPLEKRPLDFEVENLGERITSLKPEIELLALHPHPTKIERSRHGKFLDAIIPLQKFRISLFVDSSDRTLPPGEPRQYTARAKRSAELSPVLWFYRYTFTPSKGRRYRAYLRNAIGRPLSCIAFYWERFLFSHFSDYYHNKYPFDPIELDD